MIQHIYERSSPTPESIRVIRQATQNIIDVASHDMGIVVNEYSRWHTERLAFDLEYMKENFANARVLECGSFPLICTRAMSIAGLSVQGLDIHANEYRELQDALNISAIAGNIETEPFPFQDQQFDVVVFNEVFEHLRININFTFREVKRVLKSGGVLILSTPNLYSALGIYHFLRYGKSGIYTDIYGAYDALEKKGHADHIREYSPIEVVEFLDKIGFDTEKIIYRGKYSGKLFSAITSIFPRLRPFFSIHAVKRS